MPLVWYDQIPEAPEGAYGQFGVVTLRTLSVVFS